MQRQSSGPHPWWRRHLVIRGKPVLRGAAADRGTRQARHRRRRGGAHLDNSSLFITIGTTTEEGLRAITAHRDLLVITNNINVALRLYPFPAIRVMVAGGQVRHSDGAVVGPAAVDMIRQFKVDTAIIGASAIDEDGSLLDFDPLEVTVARAIMDNARRVILVCDRSKVGRVAPVRLGHLSRCRHSPPTTRLRIACAPCAPRMACVWWKLLQRTKTNNLLIYRGYIDRAMFVVFDCEHRFVRFRFDP